MIAGLLCAPPALRAGDSAKAPSARVLAVSVPAAITNLVVTPASVSISSADPDAGSVPSAVTIVSWTLEGGDKQQSWMLMVNASTAGFATCPNVPLSAVKVTCQTVATGGGASGSCSQPFLLSTSSQSIAAGTQGNNRRSYQVNLRFEFTDSWRYSATGAMQCSIDLSYTVNAL